MADALKSRPQGKGRPRQQRKLESAEVVNYLRSLPSLWADAGPEGPQSLTPALFAKTEVEGYRKMTYELTTDAVELGLQAASPEVFRLDVGEYGRGERGSASLTQVRVVLENRAPATRVWPNEFRKAS